MRLSRKILVVAAAVTASVVAAAILLMPPQVEVTVVNDTDRTVDLTCLWHNEGDVRPGASAVLVVDAGTTENCQVDWQLCLVLDTRDAGERPHTRRISEAREDDDLDCSI